MPELIWPPIMPVLSDGVVSVRAWATEDADAVYRACQDPDIARWTKIPVPYLRQHARELIGPLQEQAWASRTGALFAVVDAVDDRVLASCGLVEVDTEELVAEVGYWVAPWARRRHVGLRSVLLLSSWALTELGVGRLELLAEPANIGSCALAERAGFTREAVLASKTLHRGERRDLVMYARLS